MKATTIGFAALSLVATPGVAGQTRANPVVRSTANLPIELGTQLDVQPKPLTIREHKVVFDLPSEIIEFGRDGWNAPLRGLTPSKPKSALTVQRTRGTASTPCTGLVDRIYLRTPRVNGFVLSAYRADPLIPPPGFRPQIPLEAIATQSAAPDLPVSTFADADYVRIRPPVYTRQDGAVVSCWSGYRLSLTLWGPRGADPFAPIYRRPHR